MIITDEMLEAGAWSLFKAQSEQLCSRRIFEECKGYWLKQARAVIEGIQPVIEKDARARALAELVDTSELYRKAMQ